MRVCPGLLYLFCMVNLLHWILDLLLLEPTDGSKQTDGKISKNMFTGWNKDNLRTKGHQLKTSTKSSRLHEEGSGSPFSESTEK